MNIGQGAGRAALLCAALVSSASACAGASTASTAASSPGSKPSVSASARPSASSSVPLTGADVLAAKAVANLKAAASVHVVAVAKKPGTTGMDWDLTLFPGHGCTGSVSMGSRGTLQLTIVGTSLWYKPDSTYWQTSGAAPSVLKTLKGKYLHTTTDADGIAMALGIMCSLDDGIYGSAETLEPGLTATTTALHGQPALKLTATDGTDAMVVTKTASPQLLQILDTTSDGDTMNFTDYNTSSTLTPPPADQTLNASAYNL